MFAFDVDSRCIPHAIFDNIITASEVKQQGC